MSWIEQARLILGFPLFEIAGNPVTPLRLLVVALILIVNRYLARWIGRLCDVRFLRHIEGGPRYTLVRLIQYGIWVVVILIALRVLNVNLTAFAVVAGVLGVGIGFGLQNLVANFVAGLVLLFERPVGVNDFVTVGDVEGRVLEIGVRSTTIVTNDNISVIVPNSQFTNSTVTNWSHSGSQVRIHAPVGVAYGSDVELVQRTLLEVAARMEGVLRKPASRVWFEGFGDSALNFELRVWTAEPIRHQRLHSRLNYAIEAAFREKGIQIPFPQRDVHVRSAMEKAPAPKGEG